VIPGGDQEQRGGFRTCAWPELRAPRRGCEHVPVAQFEIRPAQAGDARAMAELFASVAEERDGIATEPPVDFDERVALFVRSPGESIVAVADGQIIGMLHLEVSRHGFGELGMLVACGGRGVGSALLAAAARGRFGAAGRSSAGSVRRCWPQRSAGRAAMGCTSSPWRYSRTIRPRSRCTASAASSKKGAAPGSTGAPAASCGTRS
jgi:hypothetical protein